MHILNIFNNGSHSPTCRKMNTLFFSFTCSYLVVMHSFNSIILKSVYIDIYGQLLKQLQGQFKFQIPNKI